MKVLWVWLNRLIVFLDRLKLINVLFPIPFKLVPLNYYYDLWMLK